MLAPRGVLPAILALLAVGTASAARAATPTCAAGRYLVRGKALLPGADGGSVIVVSGDTVSIAGLCPPTPAQVAVTSGGTRVTASWERCQGTSGRVRLAAKIGGEACRSLNGRLRGKRVRRRFRARYALADSASCAQDSTFAQIERRIFGPRGCRVETCHGNGQAGGLDLRLGAAYDALVGVPATNAAAAAAGKLRVVRGDPEASFLLQKLGGSLGAAEGARMPEVGRALDDREREVVRAWIAAGAPASGRVDDAPCLPPEQFTAAPALAPPPGGYQIAFEGPVLQPGQEYEGCMWMQVPNAEDFVVGKWEYSLNPGTHHFALWEHVYGDAPETGVFKPDLACVRGGARLDGVTVSASPEAPYFVDGYPAGVGRVVKGGSLIGVNPHYHNEFDQPVQVKGWVNLHPVAGTLRHLSDSLVSTYATLDGKTQFSIEVEPFSTGTLRLRFSPPGDQPLSIFQLTSHQHQRGTRFTARRSDGSKLFDNFDWSHPTILHYDPPLVLAPGDYIEFECDHDNGVTRTVRRCGDSPYDAKCTPGDPVTLRFGVTSVDDMCILAGSYYTE